MIACTPPALILMLPDDLQNFGQSLTATALFANNMLLLMTSGYFELEASFKPLMHTWSLAVEEQFYLIAPVLLYAAFRLGGKWAITWTICVITLVSFAFSLWTASRTPVANFLLLPSRAWELGAGAAALLFQERVRSFAPPQSRRADIFASAGAGLTGLVLLGLVTDSGVSAAAVATIGTALLLLYSQPTSGPGRFLAWQPTVAVGLISYSAYLYHQPIFAFARIVSFDPPPMTMMLALIPLIFGLARLSWRYVEQPFRDRKKIALRPMVTVFGFASVGLATIGLVLHINSGFFSEWPELQASVDEVDARQNIDFNYRPLVYSGRGFTADTSTIKVLVLGDSYARDFINMALESHNDPGLEFSYWELRDCADNRSSPTLENNLTKADFVVLAQKTGPFDCISKRLAAIRSTNHGRLAVIGTKNFGGNLNAVRMLSPAQSYTATVRPLAEFEALNETCVTAIGPSIYVDVMGLLGDKAGRLPIFTPDHKFISEDRNHVTKAGAAYIGQLIFAAHPVLADMAKAGQIARGRQGAPAYSASGQRL
jgi:peptidoglycan/LPS O-acetylase OafA/YrhL